VAVVRPGHPLANLPILSIDDLMEFTCVLPPTGGALGMQIEALFTANGRTFPNNVIEAQTQPFFGQGMCHSLRDAANFAWKLALVVAGKADDRLLDTYQLERQSQVRHAINAAVEAGRYICELDPHKAAQRDISMRAQTGIRSTSELIAPLASSIVRPGAGDRFINPELESGRRFDDVSGGGWVLVELSHHPIDKAASQVGAELAAPRGFLADWFASRKASAALLRPDFYFALVTGSPSQLSAQLVELGAQLRLEQTFVAQ
jgi:3-(3-hydroxy-phenyl)propionate hydroxylase